MKREQDLPEAVGARREEPQRVEPSRLEKPRPPEPQFIIEGAKLPWINERHLQGSREPRR